MERAGTPVLIGRTMDWPTSTDPVLTVLPRDLAHNGGRLGETMVVATNPLLWTSKYGSLVTTVYGIGAADGLNERGLSANMLYLPSTDLGRVTRPSRGCRLAFGRNTCWTPQQPSPMFWHCSKAYNW
jgi:penicillin V acylase-like amidase (Ntn superfamily)